VEDRSHRSHTLHTTLSAAQELIVIELRRLLELPLDDLLVLTQRFINPDVSRSGLNRLLRREGLGSLRPFPHRASPHPPRVILKQTEWSSASMAVSANSASKPALRAPRNLSRP
jgi:hypothetical protein